MMDHCRNSFLLFAGLTLLVVTASANAFDSIGKSISSSPSSQQVAEAADEAAINALRRQMIDGWNRGSGAAFADVFTEDADFVAIDGTRLRGRQEIAATYQQLFDSVMRGSHLADELKSVRFVSSDVALLNAVARTLMPQESTSMPRQNSVQTMVAVKRDGRWRIASLHNSRVFKIEQQWLLDNYEALPVQMKQQVNDLVASRKRHRETAIQASMP